MTVRVTLKALANEDTLLRTHCCWWCFLGCAKRETFVADTKCFWTKSETFFVSRTQNLCLQQTLRTRANGETFVSATMCPRLPGPWHCSVRLTAVPFRLIPIWVYLLFLYPYNHWWLTVKSMVLRLTAVRLFWYPFCPVERKRFFFSPHKCLIFQKCEKSVLTHGKVSLEKEMFKHFHNFSTDFHRSVTTCSFSRGELSYVRGRDACRKFWIESLQETDLGVARANFDP